MTNMTNKSTRLPVWVTPHYYITDMIPLYYITTMGYSIDYYIIKTYQEKT